MRIWQTPVGYLVLWIKFYWKTTRSIYFHTIYGCFCNARVELSSCDRDRMWPTKLKILSGHLEKNSFPIPSLDPGLKAKQAKWTRSTSWSSAHWEDFPFLLSLRDTPQGYNSGRVHFCSWQAYYAEPAVNKPWTLREVVGVSHWNNSYMVGMGMLGLLKSVQTTLQAHSFHWRWNVSGHTWVCVL